MSNLLSTFALDYYEIFDRKDLVKTCSYDREICILISQVSRIKLISQLTSINK